MGLREDFKQLAVDVLTAFDNVPEEATYKSFGEMQRVSGDLVEPVTDYPLDRVAFTTFSADDRRRFAKISNDAGPEDSVLPTDVKALIAVNDLAVTPAVGDRLIRVSKGTEYEVKGKHTDPAEALWILQLRRT